MPQVHAGALEVAALGDGEGGRVEWGDVLGPEGGGVGGRAVLLDIWYGGGCRVVIFSGGGGSGGGLAALVVIVHVGVLGRPSRIRTVESAAAAAAGLGGCASTYIHRPIVWGVWSSGFHGQLNRVCRGLCLKGIVSGSRVKHQ